MSDDIRENQFLADIRSAAQGQPTYYNLEPVINKEKYYADIITALKNGGGGGGFTPTQTQLDAMNSGIDSTKVAQIETNKTNILSVTNGENILVDNSTIDFMNTYGTKTSETLNDVTFTWNNDVCTVTGTASAHTNKNLIAQRNFPFAIKTNAPYIMNIEKSGDVVYIQLYYYTSNGSVTLLKEWHTNTNEKITFPEQAEGLILRLRVSKNGVANETVKIKFCIAYNTDYLLQEINKRIYSKLAAPYVRNNTLTLSDIREDGYYVISDSWTVTDAPSNLTVTGLTVENYSVYHMGAFIKQTVESILSPETNERYYRISNSQGTAWSNWIKCSGNNYTFPHTDNTYNVTATPTITTDTNDYLASTGDNTDVTSDIATMLSTTGICRLGAGVYYISDLDMPDNTSIIGSGAVTEIHLLGTDATEGFAIKMGSNCAVKDLMILGAENDISTNGEIVNRHGIVWEGDATENGSSNANIPTRSTIENVYIRRFKGGGITFNDTGYGVSNCVNVINSYIWNCKCGINISYWSEFHRFTGLHVSQCYYGVINNGGNNMFVNCSFSQNNLGMLMDNSNNQSPNNSHGSVVGCVFNHSGTNNNGIGIKMLNCGNGFIFSDCQLFFSKVVLEDTDGVVFSNFNCGSDIDISISGGAAVTFSDCMFGNTPSFTITDNNTVRIHDCYIRSTGAAVTLS